MLIALVKHCFGADIIAKQKDLLADILWAVWGIIFILSEVNAVFRFVPQISDFNQKIYANIIIYRQVNEQFPDCTFFVAHSGRAQ